MTEWAQKLLDVMHEREADSRIGLPCLECGTASGPDTNSEHEVRYRCSDCIGAPLLCKPCLLKVHRWSPLHHIQEWDGTHFVRKTLADLGFILAYAARLWVSRRAGDA